MRYCVKHHFQKDRGSTHHQQRIEEHPKNAGDPRILSIDRHKEIYPKRNRNDRRNDQTKARGASRARRPCSTSFQKSQARQLRTYRSAVQQQRVNCAKQKEEKVENRKPKQRSAFKKKAFDRRNTNDPNAYRAEDQTKINKYGDTSLKE